jgi:hypothetical protein
MDNERDISDLHVYRAEDFEELDIILEAIDRADDIDAADAERAAGGA